VNIKKPLRVAVYARLSQVAEESVSIARQVEACEAIALGRGWKVVQVEAEEDVSGSKKAPNQRAAFGKILANIENIDVVFFWKIDRIARNTLDFLLLARDLRERGVALAAVDDPVDLTTPAGEVVATVLVAFAQFEAAQTSARVKAARAHLLRDGRIAGGERPWPFEAVARGGDAPRLVWRPIPERGDAVREAALGVIAGTTNPSAIAAEWDRRGLPPKRGRFWDPSSAPPGTCARARAVRLR
jgi:site-specific DNA recombinase